MYNKIQMENAMRIMKMLLFLVVVIFTFISCNQFDSEPLMFVPEFMPQENITSKAMSQESLIGVSLGDRFRHDSGVITSVLCSMPLISGVKPLQKKGIITNEDLASEVYPLGIKAKLGDASQVKDDGLYCIYYLYEGEKFVGYFDYYYSTVKNSFSYRQQLIFTFSEEDSNAYIITLEYKDVSVEKIDNSSDYFYFSVGQLTDFSTGTAQKNAFCDILSIGSQYTADERTEFQRHYLTGKSANHQFASIIRPDEQYKAYWDRKYNSGEGRGNAVLAQADTLFNNSVIKTNETYNVVSDCNFDLALSITKLIYNNMDEIVKYLKGEKTYNSYEEYNLLTLEDTELSTDSIWNPLYEVTDYSSIDIADYNDCFGDCAIVYDYNINSNKTSASSRTSYVLENSYTFGEHASLSEYLNSENGHTLSELNGLVVSKVPYLSDVYATKEDAELADSSGLITSRTLFDAYYNLNSYQLVGNEFKDDYYKALFTAHLNACGITDANYIYNFYLAERYKLIDKDCNGYIYKKITNQNPEVFKTDLLNTRDEIYKADKTNYLLTPEQYEALKLNKYYKENQTD